MVYHSHVIEHFSKEDAPKFLMECYRVLKQNGIIRIAFPDLEQIVNNYMRLLQELKAGNMQYESDYDWIMLELYDQAVRNFSGGEMLKYFIRESIPNEIFVLERCGFEAKKLIEAGKNKFHKKNRLGIDIKKHIIRKILKLLIGEKRYLTLQIGKFKLSGETHQWMYDSFSLKRLLKIIGFKQIVVRDAVTSYLNNWKEYNLDTEADGTIYKPESNYIEALK